MSDITINPLELASELAHLRVLAENPSLTEDDLWCEDVTFTLIYKEEIQDQFNVWYEFYLDHIESITL